MKKLRCHEVRLVWHVRDVDGWTEVMLGVQTERVVVDPTELKLEGPASQKAVSRRFGGPDLLNRNVRR